ncbi:MAG TPA: HAD-IA family hydrolase [Aggregatilineales bacterium]|nr:HAD-IA family hydrolase [Aggregatilineales bacterium]
MNVQSSQTIQIEKYRCISFDVFDTAIQRRVLRPYDIHILTGRRSAHILGSMPPEVFRAFREQAENFARRRVQRQRGHVEITLDDIYEELAAMLALKPQQREELRQMEIDTEIDNAEGNPYILKVYEEAINASKAVIFVSDMYLPVEVIERMLEKSGYKGGHRVFVSSQFGTTKSNGGLYRKVLEITGLTAADVLHLGDNHHSDVQVARSIGLNAMHYKDSFGYAVEMGDQRMAELKRIHISDVESRTAALSINKFYTQRPAALPTREDFWYRLGYETIGPLYYGFTVWLMNEVKAAECQHLYFLSRDGYILEKVLDLFEATGGPCLPHSYLYASRRVFNFPMISAMDDDAFRFLLASGREELSAADFLTRIGFKAADYTSQMTQAGITSPSQIVASPADFDKLRTLFTLLEQPIIKAAADERAQLEAYLEQENLWDHERVAIVDVGWNGTMQKSLQRLIAKMEHSVELFGYYFGTFKSDLLLPPNAFGYLINSHEPRDRFHLLLEGVWLIEMMLFAPHGSVVRLKRDADKIVPVFASEPHNEYRERATREMQSGALDFVRDTLNMFGVMPMTVEEAARPLQRVMFKPTPLEIEMLGDLQLGESFGELDKALYVAKPTGRFLFKPKQMLREYKQASWKEGYLRRSKANPLYKFGLRTMRRLKWARSK